MGSSESTESTPTFYVPPGYGVVIAPLQTTERKNQCLPSLHIGTCDKCLNPPSRKCPTCPNNGLCSECLKGKPGNTGKAGLSSYTYVEGVPGNLGEPGKDM